MKSVRLYLGVFIASPVSVLTGLLYILPFWALGWHRYIGVKTSTSEKSPLGVGLTWELTERAPGWLLKVWEGWYGHCVGSFVVMNKLPESADRAQVFLNHELHHAHQMHTLGFVQPALYALSMFTAWLAGEKPYEANHFEVAARRVAGQVADVKSFAQGYAWRKGNSK